MRHPDVMLVAGLEGVPNLMKSRTSGVSHPQLACLVVGEAKQEAGLLSVVAIHMWSSEIVHVEGQGRPSVVAGYRHDRGVQEQARGRMRRSFSAEAQYASFAKCAKAACQAICEAAPT